MSRPFMRGGRGGPPGMSRGGPGGPGGFRGGRGGPPGRGGPRGGGPPRGGFSGYGNGGGYGQQHGGGDGYGNEYGGYNQGYNQGSGYGAYGNQPDFSSPLDAEIQVVLGEISSELSLFEAAGEYGEQFRNARRLLTSEKEKLENCIDPEWIEVDIPKPVKVTKKVLIPNYRYPNFNFVGKVLGPKGATLQAMAKKHKCHIFVLGRGSTKDRNKESELLASGDPQYAHYGGPLHVKIETYAPPHIAYVRVASVLEDLSKILVPIREDTTPADLKESLGRQEPNGDGESSGPGPIKSENDHSARHKPY